MREIEFRGKGINEFDNIWVYGDLLYNTPDGRCFIQIKDYIKNPIEINKSSIGQYTGLKDKNGKKIFEGDIIHIEEENLYGLVCFENCQWYVYYYGWIDKEGIGYVYDIVNENPLADELLTNENKIWLEIVGNKYDNPEFLEVEE